MKKIMFLFLSISALILLSCSADGITGGGDDGNGDGGNGGGGGDDSTIGPAHDAPLNEDSQILFDTTGAQSYRIPGIIALNDGNTILAVADDRYSHGGDIGQDRPIDIVVRKSVNRGKTWSAAKIIGKKSTGGADAHGDPLIFEAENGDIVILAAGGGGWHIGGNPATPSLLWMSRSKDRGDTWSNWKQVQKPIFDHLKTVTGGFVEDKVYVKGFISAGRGYTAEDGTLMGAMLIGDKDNAKVSCLYISSDDNGETWKAGGIVDGGGVNEPKVVGELSDGRILMSIRPWNSGNRIWSYSSDKGTTWSAKTTDPAAWSSASNGEGLIYTYTFSDGTVDNKNRILHIFASGRNGQGRERLAIYTTYDEMRTIRETKVIFDDGACYSSIDILKDGTIVTLAEEQSSNGGYYDIVFRRFNLYWLTDGADYPGKK